MALEEKEGMVHWRTTYHSGGKAEVVGQIMNLETAYTKEFGLFHEGSVEPLKNFKQKRKP